MLRVTLIGANGFVGSAFARLLRNRSGIELREVTRENYSPGTSDVVIDAAGNSKKFIADSDPAADFELSVAHRMRTLRDFPAPFHLHVSSVDVYDDLTSTATTTEDTTIDRTRSSNYGLHKLMAEDLVKHYAKEWLVVRLAGMVGEGLRKNPVYDILTGGDLRIHPDSRYQFMSTDDAAATAWSLFERGKTNEVFNVCGSGVVSPREIAALAGKPVKFAGTSSPRIVDVSISKIESVMQMPDSHKSVTDFIARWTPAEAVSRP